MFEILFLIVVAAYFIQASLLSIGSKRKFSKIDEAKLEPATVIVAARNEEKNILSPLHTADFDIDEDCLEIGVMLHVLNTLSFAKL